MRSNTLAHFLSLKFYIFSLPKASLSLKHTSARRKSGHSLGTFKTGDEKKVSYSSKCSVSCYLSHFLFSLYLLEVFVWNLSSF
jgi:hypothetical protein